MGLDAGDMSCAGPRERIDHEITGVCVQLDGPPGEFERKPRGMTCSLGVVVTDSWDVPDLRGPSTLGVAREFPLLGPLVGLYVRLFLRCPGWRRLERLRCSSGND